MLLQGPFCFFAADSPRPPILGMPPLASPLDKTAEGVGQVGQTKIQLVGWPECCALLWPGGRQPRGLIGKEAHSFRPLTSPFA